MQEIPEESWPKELKDALQTHLTTLVVTKDENDIPVNGADSHWQCTCGAVSPIVPLGGAILTAALTHQVESIQLAEKVTEALERQGIQVVPKEE